MAEKEAAGITAQLLDEPVDPVEILGDCREAMTFIGQRFEQQEVLTRSLSIAMMIWRTVSSRLVWT